MTFLVGEGKHYLFAKVTHLGVVAFLKRIFILCSKKIMSIDTQKSARLHFHEVIVVNCIRNGYTFNYSLGGHLEQWSKFELKKRIMFKYTNVHKFIILYCLSN